MAGFVAEPDGYLFVYSKGSRVPKPISPRGCCKIRGYYRFRAQDQIIDLEHSTLLDEVEGNGLSVVRNLTVGKHVVSQQERLSLAQYLALAAVRTPAYEVAFMKNAISSYAQERGATSDLDEIQLERNGRGNGIETRPDGTVSISHGTAWMNRSMHVSLITKSIEYLGGTLCQMNWKLLFAAAGTHFVTTDNPWAPVAPNGRPFTRQGMVNAVRDCACLFFPLRKDLCLMAAPGSGTHAWQLVSSEHVQWVNAYLISNAYKYKICSVPDIMSLLPPGSQWDATVHV